MCCLELGFSSLEGKVSCEAQKKFGVTCGGMEGLPGLWELIVMDCHSLSVVAVATG